MLEGEVAGGGVISDNSDSRYVELSVPWALGTNKPATKKETNLALR